MSENLNEAIELQLARQRHLMAAFFLFFFFFFSFFDCVCSRALTFDGHQVKSCLESVIPPAQRACDREYHDVRSGVLANLKQNALSWVMCESEYQDVSSSVWADLKQNALSWVTCESEYQDVSSSVLANLM